MRRALLNAVGMIRSPLSLRSERYISASLGISLTPSVNEPMLMLSVRKV